MTRSETAFSSLAVYGLSIAFVLAGLYGLAHVLQTTSVVVAAVRFVGGVGMLAGGAGLLAGGSELRTVRTVRR